MGCIPSNKYFCEPNLGKRNLYPLISKKGSYTNLKIRMNLLAYADGQNNIFSISKKINVPLKKVLIEYKILLKISWHRNVHFLVDTIKLHHNHEFANSLDFS